MAGVTNAPFREMCRKFAPGLVYVNEMAMATPVASTTSISTSVVRQQRSPVRAAVPRFRLAPNCFGRLFVPQ
jgi:tRNA-dihydrouridine synthase